MDNLRITQRSVGLNSWGIASMIVIHLSRWIGNPPLIVPLVWGTHLQVKFVGLELKNGKIPRIMNWIWRLDSCNLFEEEDDVRFQGRFHVSPGTERPHRCFVPTMMRGIDLRTEEFGKAHGQPFPNIHWRSYSRLVWYDWMIQIIFLSACWTAFTVQGGSVRSILSILF